MSELRPLDLLIRFEKIYTLAYVPMMMSCCYCKHTQRITDSKRPFVHNKECDSPEKITEYPWIHYNCLIALFIGKIPYLIGMDQLYYEATAAEFAYAKALADYFGDNAEVMRYMHNWHTPELNRLRLIKVEASDTLRAYIKANPIKEE